MKDEPDPVVAEAAKLDHSTLLLARQRGCPETFGNSSKINDASPSS
jgi:hypothetical protein